MLEIIWNVLLVIIAITFLCFTFVILFGAPYLPTLKPRINDAFDLLKLRKGGTLLELGSGDGRVLKEAAKRGYNAVGIEYNPLLVMYSKVVTFPYRKQVRVRWGNFWTMPLPDTDAVFVFLLDRYMTKLDELLQSRYTEPTKLVSFAFKVPGRTIQKQKRGLYMYMYPSLKKKRQ